MNWALRSTTGRGWWQLVGLLGFMVGVTLSPVAGQQPYRAIGRFEAPVTPRGASARARDVETTLTARYLAAVADAAVAEPSEIARNLVALTTTTAGLIWRGSGADQQLLVVTWTSWGGYAASVGSTTTLTRDVWVTVAPQLQTFCASHAVAPEARTLRLEQLLGLPPGNGKTTFVQFWVNPDDLFRPSPDPEVTDGEAGLAWPRSSRYVAISSDYQAWFNSLCATSYGSGGYPWTRLGYTYDWGSTEGEVGLSEFVIRAGATVGVESSVGTEDYLNNPAATDGAWSRYP